MRAGLGAALFAEGGGLTDALAEEVEGGAAGMTVARDLDLLDARRVHQERALDADARGDPADRDLFVQPTVADAKDRALELLEPLAVPLDDADGNGDGVTRPDLWEIGLEVLGGKRLQDVVHRH